MNEIVSSQALIFITSVEVGIVMGMIFDLIRVIRKIIKHPNFFVQIEDLLYWIVCGLIGFYMLYVSNYADIRAFIFIGIILGAVLYFATFSIVFMKAATAVINYIKALVRRLWQLFLIPIRWFVKTLKRPIRYVKNKAELEKQKRWIEYRKRLRVKYQQYADKQTDKYLESKYKKINLEEKRQAKLKQQEEAAQLKKVAKEKTYQKENFKKKQKIE